MFWSVAELLEEGGLQVASSFIGREGYPLGELIAALQRHVGGGRVTPGTALAILKLAGQAWSSVNNPNPPDRRPTPPRAPVPPAPNIVPNQDPADVVYQYKYVIVVPTELGEVRIPVIWESNYQMSRRSIQSYLQRYLAELGDPDYPGLRTARYGRTGRVRYIPIYEVIREL